MFKKIYVKMKCDKHYNVHEKKWEKCSLGQFVFEENNTWQNWIFCVNGQRISIICNSTHIKNITKIVKNAIQKSLMIDNKMK